VLQYRVGRLKTAAKPARPIIVRKDAMLWRYRTFALLTTVVLVAVFGNSCRSSEDREILVSAAISLKNAFEEIGPLYEKQTGIRVNLNLGASGILQKQIEAGAPSDIYASAGVRQMDELQNQGLILADTRRNIAGNALVLIVPANSEIPIHSFEDLTHPQITKVAIGNPKTVPAGQYARQALKNLNLWDKLESRLVLAENVRQVLDYVVRGEAETGMVYGSDVSIARGKITVAVHAPEGSHDPILYPIAAVKTTEHRSEAQGFIDLILNRAGQEILAKYGFIPLR
jgi:molybdate transport system substrate-binding protein